MRTANNLWHAVAGALAGAMGASVLLPSGVKLAAFAGGMAALLVNLDRVELPQGKRTPFAHSLVAWLGWSYALALILYSLLPQSAVFAVSVGIVLGYGSHVLMDLFCGEGVYAFPNREFPALEPLPEGCSRQWAGWKLVRLGRRTVAARSGVVKSTPAESGR